MGEYYPVNQAAAMGEWDVLGSAGTPHPNDQIIQRKGKSIY
jgi:hypothetical protein